MVEPAVALIAAIFGGVGLKFVEFVIGRSKAKSDIAAEMRAELRSDVVSLKEELDAIEASLEVWKKKYYRVLYGFNELSIAALAAGLSGDVERIRKEIDFL
jgi:hypothetical protein